MRVTFCSISFLAVLGFLIATPSFSAENPDDNKPYSSSHDFYDGNCSKKQTDGGCTSVTSPNDCDQEGPIDGVNCKLQCMCKKMKSHKKIQYSSSHDFYDGECSEKQSDEGCISVTSPNDCDQESPIDGVNCKLQCMCKKMKSHKKFQ